MTGIIGRADLLRGRLLNIIGLAKYHLLERQFIHTMRIGLVATTLGLTLITALLIAKRGEIGFAIVGLIATLCVLVFVYHYLAAAIWGLLIVSTITDFPLPRDITVTLLLLIVTALVWLFKLLVSDRSFSSIRPAPPNKPALLFVLAVLISYFWSLLYVDPAASYIQKEKYLPNLTTMIVLILSPVAMLMVGNLFKSKKIIKAAIVYYIIYSYIALFFLLLDIDLPPMLNAKGQIPAWTCIFAMGQILWNDKITRLQRILLLALIAGWMHVQIGLGFTWLSGWVPVLVGLAILIFLRSRVLFLMMILLVVVYGVINSEGLSKSFEAEEDESGGTRMDAYTFFLDTTSRHYLFGTGPTGPYFYLMTYAQGRLGLSHNNYVDILTQTGIFGFTCWIILWSRIGRMMWKVYRGTPRTGFDGGLTASLFTIFFVCLVTMMLGDWITPFTYTQTLRGLSYTIWPWLWLGLGISYYIRLQNPPAASDQPNSDLSQFGDK
jgi:O-antigen ligase